MRIGTKPTKRKLYSYEFKGRPRRALLWTKRTYEMWFLFARVHQREGGKIPKEFGDLSQFSGFEEWWRHEKYGFDLFCEQEHKALVELVTSTKTPKEDGTALVRVRLNADLDLVVRDFEIALRHLQEHEEYSSTARFQPSQHQKQIKLKKLEEALSAYIVSQEMVHRRAIHRLYRKGKAEHRKIEKKSFERKVEVDALSDEHGNKKVYRYETYRRRVWVDNPLYDNWVIKKTRTLSRQRRMVKQVFKNIEQRTFP
jgi:hypothetical protein